MCEAREEDRGREADRFIVQACFVAAFLCPPMRVWASLPMAVSSEHLHRSHKGCSAARSSLFAAFSGKKGLKASEKGALCHDLWKFDKSLNELGRENNDKFTRWMATPANQASLSLVQAPLTPQSLSTNRGRSTKSQKSFTDLSFSFVDSISDVWSNQRATFQLHVKGQINEPNQQ